jgi:hypothetical protein
MSSSIPKYTVFPALLAPNTEMKPFSFELLEATFERLLGVEHCRQNPSLLLTTAPQQMQLSTVADQLLDLSRDSDLENITPLLGQFDRWVRL